MKIFIQCLIYVLLIFSGLNGAAASEGTQNFPQAPGAVSSGDTLSKAALLTASSTASSEKAFMESPARIKVIYPYSMSGRQVAPEGSITLPLYISFTEFDVKNPGKLKIQLQLPDNFIALKNAEWQEKRTAKDVFYEFTGESDKGFSRIFSLLYIKALPGTLSGEKTLKIKAVYEDENKKLKTLRQEKTFNYTAAASEDGSDAENSGDETGTFAEKTDSKTDSNKSESAASQNLSKKHTKENKFNWYILSVILPVDEDGHKDPKSEEGAIYVPDNKIEDMRNRITGEGATNWAAVLEHPVCYLQLNIRNPQQDVAMLKFKAYLKDRHTGQIVPGLCTGGQSESDNQGGGFAKDRDEYATTAVFTLDGSKASSVVLPVYVDSLRILPGDYFLRVELEGAGQDKVTEVPVSITKRHSMGIFAVIFAVLTLPFVLYRFFRLNKEVEKLGARGAITVALFAAVSFGGITVPATLLSDFVHAFLGPFSIFITGCLSGIMQYLLLMALLILFRRPGVITLLLLLKFILTAVIFGRFTPLGILDRKSVV